MAALALALPVFAQDSLLNPLERALSGVVTVGVYDVADNDQVLGMVGKNKSYADIAYAETLEMNDVYSNGSGFVIEHEGQYYILTNAHVIDAASNQAGSIYVYSITRVKYPVKVVGGDSFYDLAILAFDGMEPGEEIEPLKFSDKGVELAQKVYGIGNPLGAYPYTITEGIISGKNRLFHRPSTGRYGFLQHTATLIWGNSGGPLVNAEGEVIGVNTWVETRNKGGQNYLFSQLNFALEGQKARQLFLEMMANEGSVRRAFLGLEFAVSGGNYFQPQSRPILSGVLESSPAYEELQDKIGLPLAGINGEPVNTLQDIVHALEEAEPGDAVELSFKSGILSSTVSIPSSELGNKEMGDIARYFFQQYTDYNVQEDNGGVKLVAQPDKETPRLEIDASGVFPPEQAEFSPTKGEASYGLAGLGLMSQSGGGTLYRIHTLRHLAAVIRLCTLEGHLGADLLGEGERLRRARIFVENDNFEFGEAKVLYY